MLQACLVGSREEAQALGLEFTSTAEISLGATQGAPDGTNTSTGTNGSVSADAGSAAAAVNGSASAGEGGASVSELWIGVGKAEGGKCERCWNYSLSVGEAQKHPTLCDRCAVVVASLEGTQVPVAV